LVLIEFRKQGGLCIDQRLSGFGGNRFIGFETPIAANVKHGVAALGEYATDEQAAVAVGGVFLSAEKSDAESFHAGFKPCNRSLEAVIVAEAAVENMALGVVIGRVLRAAAQLRTKKKISKPGLLQRTLNKIPVKLRYVFGVGRTARIDHNLDGMPTQEFKPRLNGMVGVADGEETAHAPALQ
jgi:hypothetical protein